MKIKSPITITILLVGYLLILAFLIAGGLAKSVGQHVGEPSKPATILLSPLLLK